MTSEPVKEEAFYVAAPDKIYYYNIIENALDVYHTVDSPDPVTSMVQMDVYERSIYFITRQGRTLHRLQASQSSALPHVIPLAFDAVLLMDGWSVDLRKVLYAVSSEGDIYQYTFKQTVHGTEFERLQPACVGKLPWMSAASMVRMYQREGLWHVLSMLQDDSLIWQVYDVQFKLLEEICLTDLMTLQFTHDDVMDMILCGCKWIIATRTHLYIFDAIRFECTKKLVFLPEEELLNLCLHYTTNGNLHLYVGAHMLSKPDTHYIIGMTIEGERIQDLGLDPCVTEYLNKTLSLSSLPTPYTVWSIRDERFNTKYMPTIFSMPLSVVEDYLDDDISILQTSTQDVSNTERPYARPIEQDSYHKYKIICTFNNRTYELKKEVSTVLFDHFEILELHQGECTKPMKLLDDKENASTSHILYELIAPQEKTSLSYKLYYNRTIRDIGFVLDAPSQVKLMIHTKEQTQPHCQPPHVDLYKSDPKYTSHPIQCIDTCLLGSRKSMLLRYRTVPYRERIPV